MDNIAHTLVGATLAEAGLRYRTRYATATLMIGSNLPDIDALATILGRDMSLYLRRGWTHGVLALLVLPALLVGAVLLWHRFRGARDPDAPPVDVRWLFALSYLSTWLHPVLDWMNTYGVRLLMPFDGRWFYGDTLFIVDPWFWLLTAAGVVLARSSSRKAIAGWTVLGGLASFLIVAVPFVPVAVKVVWFLGVSAIILLRGRLGQDASRMVSRAGFATLVVYIGIVFGLARLAESAARQDPPPLEVQSSPVPGVPFEHRVVAVYETHYRVIPPHADPFDVPRIEPDAIVEAALAADSIKGFANWTRFPYWEVEALDDGWLVTFRDLRYVDPGEPARGIGMASVRLDKDLKPRE